MNPHYALITGASEGLGKFLAIECASRNINMVLVALPGTGIPHLARFLERKYNIQVLGIETDLSDQRSCFELYNTVHSQGIRISILINNAGLGGTFNFGNKEPEFYTKLISLNAITPTVLCRLFLPDLKASAPSYLLNVSSLAGFFNLPGKQVYGGTKSYLLSFSRSLRLELKRQNIFVSILCPGGMNTNWRLTLANRTSGTRLSRISIMDPADVAAIAINQMFRRKELIIPGFLNHCFLFWNKMFPKQLKESLMEYQFSKTIGMRKPQPLKQLEPVLVPV